MEKATVRERRRVRRGRATPGAEPPSTTPPSACNDCSSCRTCFLVAGDGRDVVWANVLLTLIPVTGAAMLFVAVVEVTG